MKFSLAFKCLLMFLVVIITSDPLFAKKGGGPPPPPVPGPGDLKALMGADWSCFMSSYRFKGIEICIKKYVPVPCIKIGHKYPTGLAEVITKEPGDTQAINPTTLISMALLVEIAKKAMKMMFGYGPSSGVAGSGTKTDKQAAFTFNDVHVYTFPDFIKLMEEASKQVPALKPIQYIIQYGTCSPNQGIFMAPLYYTESDFIFWRTGVQDIFKVMSFQALLQGAKGCSDFSVPGSNSFGVPFTIPGSGTWCLGNYGNIYPRRGWATHWNEPSTAYYSSYKAFSMANSGGAIRTGFYNWSVSTSSSVQESEPISGSCQPYGGNYYFHYGFKAFASDGIYWYVHWPELECCSPCYGTRQVN